MMDKIPVYMCLHIASIKSTAGNKTRLFPKPFLVSTGWRLTLALSVPERLRSCLQHCSPQCYWGEWIGWLRNRSVSFQIDTA